MTTDLTRDRRAGLAVVGSLIAFGGLFALVRANRTAALDLELARRVQAVRSRPFDRLMAAVSWPGFPPQSRIVPPVLISAWAVTGHPLEAAFQAAAWASAAVSTAVKSVVRRPRPVPPDVRVAPGRLDGTSFPSGHVLTYTAFYGFLAVLLTEHVRRPAQRRLAVAAIVGLVALVGPSRVQRGHHWPTDVLGSYLLGLGWLAALSALYRRARSNGGYGGSRNVNRSL